MPRVITLTMLIILSGCSAHELNSTITSRPLIKGPYEISNPMIKVKSMPPLPPYPTKAKAERIQGDVVIAVTIDKAGNTVSTKVIDGPLELVSYAESILLQMRFTPLVVDGNPVETTFQFIMPFRLR